MVKLCGMPWSWYDCAITLLDMMVETGISLGVIQIEVVGDLIFLGSNENWIDKLDQHFSKLDQDRRRLDLNWIGSILDQQSAQYWINWDQNWIRELDHGN